MASPIALRCYVANERGANDQRHPINQVLPSNSLVLVFDTETTVDEFQNLLFGSCGIWSNGNLEHFILFYNEEMLKQNEIQAIKNIASKFKYEIMTRSEFVERIFYPYVFMARAKCVCFNSPFDLSKLQISYGRSKNIVTDSLSN